ncbi:MAG: hypothetical protein K0S09_707 [Sphingobacteriaceae bacterium]|jgi:hypothetical protein|nr:hypothetical protein [Sphingobacteriaceae bacterium]
MKYSLLAIGVLSLCFNNAVAQEKPKHEDTEFYTPVPKVITPGATPSDAPSDAIVLFNGTDLDQWVSTADRAKKAEWLVSNGDLTVDKSKGNIETKQAFGSYQLHIEWKEPAVLSGKGQARGNSGIFLASTGKGDAGYELQVLDSYKNDTYVNGQAGSIYKQYIPLVNASKPPGQWQQYDVIWTAPSFKEDGSVASPARVTVFYNGILVQNNVELKGETVYIGQPFYNKHGKSPIKLQAHGDPSEPISFRNIWVREL